MCPLQWDGSGAWTRTRITSSKGWRATNCTTPEQGTESVADMLPICYFQPSLHIPGVLSRRLLLSLFNLLGC